jgi:hypothetical protein
VERERKKSAKVKCIFLFQGYHRAVIFPNSIRVKIPYFKEGKITLFRIGSYLNLVNGAMFLPCTPHSAVVEFCSVSVAEAIVII